LDAGEGLYALLDLLLKLNEAVVSWRGSGKVGGVFVEAEDEYILLVEAGVRAGELDEAAQEQAGSGEEQDRKGDLANDEAASQGVAGGSGCAASAFLECWGELKTRGAQSGDYAEEQRGQDCEQQGECEDGKIGCEVDGNEGGAGSGHVQEHCAGFPGEGDAEG